MRSTFRTFALMSTLGVLAACSDATTGPQLATTDGTLPVTPTPRPPAVDTLPFVAQTLQADSALVRVLTDRGAGAFLEDAGNEQPHSFRPLRDTMVTGMAANGTTIQGEVRAQTVRTGQVEAIFRFTRAMGSDTRALSVAVPIAMRVDSAILVAGSVRTVCRQDSSATVYAVRCGTTTLTAGTPAVLTIRGAQRVSVIAPVAMTAFHGTATAQLPITAIVTNSDLARLDLTTPGVVSSAQRVAIGLNVNSSRADTLHRITALVAVLPSREGETIPTGLMPENMDGRFNTSDMKECVALLTRSDVAVWRCAMDGGVRVGLTRLTTGGRMSQTNGAVVQDYRVVVGLLSVDGIRHTGIERFAQTSVRITR